MTLPDLPADWLLQHLGQDGHNSQWNCTLIHDGEFYNGTAWEAPTAILLALNSDPYVPVEPTYTSQPASIDLDAILANLRKSHPPAFRQRL